MTITKNRWFLGTTTVAAGLGLVVSAATVAAADPIDSETGGYTLNRTLNGTGSDTIQDLLNGLSAVVTDGSGNPLIGSWDATVPAGQGSFIATHTGGTSIPRPNGSGQGVSALDAAVDGELLTNARGTSSAALNRGDLQFARSSSTATWAANGTFSYIPIAADAVTYATGATTAVPSSIPLGTAVGQDSDNDGTLDLTLMNIYTRNATGTTTVPLEDASGTVVTVGRQGSGAGIVPFIPQPGSGTRSFWQSTVGGTFGSVVSDTFTYSSTQAECDANVVTHSYASGICTTQAQEHNGEVTAKVTNAMVPFSIAQYIAQGNSAALEADYGVEVVNRQFGAVLRSIDGKSPIDDGVLNTAFPVTRPVFVVVEHDALGSTAAPYAAFGQTLQNVFVGASGAIYGAEAPDGQSFVIEDFGFGSLINRDTNINEGITYKGALYTAGDAETFRTNVN